MMRGPRILTALYSLVVLALLAAGLRLSPIATAKSMRVASSAAAANPAAGRPVTFTVEQGMSPDAIATGLEQTGVLTDVRLFNFLLGVNSAGRELRAGCYILGPSTPVAEIVRRLRGGVTSVQLLAIPEGRRLEEVGTILQQAGIADTAAWQAALAAAPRDHLPTPLPASRSLLGYLLPASYPLQCKASADAMVSAMLDAFTQQVTPDLVSAMGTEGLSLDEGITLASIVEREAVLPSEQPLIASVFLNRLHAGLPLQADPTVQFALDSANPPTKSDGWWKRTLTDADLAIESPYNTYRHPGLPPGPIANPGIDAIRAVAHAAKTDYLYFVAKGDGSGSHAFASTLEQHNANVQKYRK